MPPTSPGSGPTRTSTKARPSKPSIKPGTSATASYSSSPPAPPSASSLLCSKANIVTPASLPSTTPRASPSPSSAGTAEGRTPSPRGSRIPWARHRLSPPRATPLGSPPSTHSERTSAFGWKKVQTSRRWGPRSSRERRSASSPSGAGRSGRCPRTSSGRMSGSRP